MVKLAQGNGSDPHWPTSTCRSLDLRWLKTPKSVKSFDQEDNIKSGWERQEWKRKIHHSMFVFGFMFFGHLTSEPGRLTKTSSNFKCPNLTWNSLCLPVVSIPLMLQRLFHWSSKKQPDIFRYIAFRTTQFFEPASDNVMQLQVLLHQGLLWGVQLQSIGTARWQLKIFPTKGFFSPVSQNVVRTRSEIAAKMLSNKWNDGQSDNYQTTKQAKRQQPANKAIKSICPIISANANYLYKGAEKFAQSDQQSTEEWSCWLTFVL